MDKTSTGTATIGEASKCAESGKMSMSRPPKMIRILENVVNLNKIFSAKEGPENMPKNQKKKWGENGLFIGKT